MSDRWISVTAESADRVRIARLEDCEDSVASFNVSDANLESVDQYERTLIAEAYKSAEEVPDQYSPNTIFRVVQPSRGEFVVSSLDHFNDRVDGDEYTVGLRFDADLNARYREIIDEIIG